MRKNRRTNRLYLAVSTDELSYIVAMAPSMQALAKWLGVSQPMLSNAISAKKCIKGYAIEIVVFSKKKRENK